MQQIVDETARQVQAEKPLAGWQEAHYPQHLPYPSLAWVQDILRQHPRYNLAGQVAQRGLWDLKRHPVRAAYIIGSEAEGCARPESDLDIALLIDPIGRKSALQITEAFQSSRFHRDWQFPHWRGRRVDFEFFYGTEPEWARYSKIGLLESASVPLDAVEVEPLAFPRCSRAYLKLCLEQGEDIPAGVLAYYKDQV